MILHVLIATVAGWIPQHQQRVITYLQEENRVLKTYLHGRQMRSSITVPSSQGHRRDRVHQRRAAMSQTVRQMIIDILREGPATAKELSARVRVPEKDVFPHLAHIRKTLHRSPQRLVTEPAWCRACGFVFHTRERFRKPGRCPSCQHSFIEEPVFRIQA